MTMENRATLRRARIRTSQATNLAEQKRSGTKKDKVKLPKKNFTLKNKYYPPQDEAKRGGSGWWRH
jgi:hypothetical protein